MLLKMGVCVQGTEQNVSKCFLNACYFLTISNDNNMAKEIAGAGQMAQGSEHLLSVEQFCPWQLYVSAQAFVTSLLRNPTSSGFL